MLIANGMKHFERKFRRSEIAQFLDSEARQPRYKGKELQRRLYGRRFNQMIQTKTADPEALRKARMDRLVKKHARRRRILRFLRDINFYVDFCIARYIVWRETRRRKKTE